MSLASIPESRPGANSPWWTNREKFAESNVLQLADPNKDLEGAEKTLCDLVQKHNIRAITVGNGTGSRETESFVRAAVQKNNLDVFVVVVNEAGASVYSASKRAREEFPELDIIIRGAISIARRLQDPLAELVKIEPRFHWRWSISTRCRSKETEEEPGRRCQFLCQSRGSGSQHRL
jgi:uncharacterized protein